MEETILCKILELCVMTGKVGLLGHIITKEEISVDPAKIEAIKNWPRPTNVTEV